MALLFRVFCLALLAVLPFSPIAVNASGPAVAFSFDDGFDPRHNAQAVEQNLAILSALDDAGVHAILFPAGHIVDSPQGLALVHAWGAAGHAIGNHSYSHSNLASDAVSLSAYIADAARNQALLEDQPGWVKRFRFPYLKEGDTAEKRDGFRNWLAESGYASGAVSIDASDWYYNTRFLRWHRAHPDADTTPFRDAYLAHLLDRAQYYDGLSRQVLGRSVKHVLLLHTNAINADFLPDIIAMFRAQGWNIVSPQDAYADPVYARTIDVLPAGESILWSLAKRKGIGGLRYPAEDSVYEEDKLERFKP